MYGYLFSTVKYSSSSKWHSKQTNKQITHRQIDRSRRITNGMEREEKSRERQRPVFNDIHLQIKTELFPFREILQINMLISRPFVAIQRTEMGNHSDDAENDRKFWGLPLFASEWVYPSVSECVFVWMSYLHFWLIVSLSILLNVEITQWQSKQAHVFFLFVFFELTTNK